MEKAEIQIDEEEIPGLLRIFYERVRNDNVLGPLFNDAVQDWEEHLARIGDFWSSIMLSSGRYKGNPIAMHLLHAGRITPEMFDRWLGLWTSTTDELLPHHAATAMQAKAMRIAENIKSAIRITAAL